MGIVDSVRSPDSVSIPRSASNVEIVAIGSSTGGPMALVKLFKCLSGRLDAPIVVTQHIPKNFTSALAQSLSDVFGKKVHEAHEGMIIERGCAYIAPGNRHLLLRRRGAETFCALDAGPEENFCRPSVDPMLRSVAQAYKARAVAVILTGMGRDGLEGCKAVKAAGGRILAQDQASSAVWGMPRAVADAGLCEAVLPVERIAEAILRYAQRP